MKKYTEEDLTKKRCVPCEGGTKPFSSKQAKVYLKQVRDWKFEGNKIKLDIKFKNFKEAMKFVNKVARLAEKERHHPDILIYSWNRVRFILYTHAIGGLSENDFILAAKINELRR